jgi:hypothetical protein
LACRLLHADKTVESIQFFRRAVELYESVLAVDAGQKQARADLAAAYAGLGYVLAHTGDLGDAWPMNAKR